MALEVISEIRQAENKASRMLNEAQEEAKQILRDAAKDCEAKKQELLQSAKEEAGRIASDLDVQARQEVQNRLQENESEILALTQSAQQHMAEAVDFVIGRVLS